MKLSKALLKRAASLRAANKDYKLAVSGINVKVVNIVGTSLPALHAPPPNWNQAVAAYSKARTAAADWTRQVMGELLSTPPDVVKADTRIRKGIAEAHRAAVALCEDPTNKDARTYLLDQLDNLNYHFSAVAAEVRRTKLDLWSFQSEIPQIAEDFAKISNLAISSSKADQDQINSLKLNQRQLEQMINMLIAALILEAVVGLIIVIGLIAMGDWESVAQAVMAFGGAITLTYVAILECKKAIDRIHLSMDQITRDMATLAIAEQTFSNLSVETQGLNDKIGLVVNEWNILSEDVSKALGEIGQAITDSQNPYMHSYMAAASDLEMALALWDESLAQAASLELEVEVSDVTLTIGMDENQIQQALKGGVNTGVVQYVNKLSAMPTVA